MIPPLCARTGGHVVFFSFTDSHTIGFWPSAGRWRLSDMLSGRRYPFLAEEKANIDRKASFSKIYERLPQVASFYCVMILTPFPLA